MSNDPLHPSLTVALPWLAAFVIGAAAHVSVVREIQERPVQRSGPLIDVDIDVEMVPELAQTSAPPAERRANGRGVIFTVDEFCFEGAMTDVGRAALFQVRQLDASHFEVEREFVELMLQTSPSSYARVVPSVHEGKTVGAKVFAIRECSPLRLLGLKNGDLLRSINGQPVFDRETGVVSYAPVPRPELVRLELERKGEPLTLSYRILDTPGGG